MFYKVGRRLYAKLARNKDREVNRMRLFILKQEYNMRRSQKGTTSLHAGIVGLRSCFLGFGYHFPKLTRSS